MCRSTDTGLTVLIICAVDVEVTVGWDVTVEIGEEVALSLHGTQLLTEVRAGGLIESNEVDLS